MRNINESTERMNGLCFTRHLAAAFTKHLVLLLHEQKYLITS